MDNVPLKFKKMLLGITINEKRCRNCIKFVRILIE